MRHSWPIFVTCCWIAPAVITCGCKSLPPESEGAQPVRWEADWTLIHSGAYPRLAKLGNGDLLAAFDERVERQSTIGLMRSADNGRTWNGYARGAAYPASDDVANAFPLELSDGSLVVAFRHHSPDKKIFRLELRASDDGGATWHAPSTIATGTVGLWEPFLIELPDRTLQVYYASEEGIFPEQRVEMRASRDGGRTWSQPTTVARSASSRDGMPGVLRLADGTLFVVFEASDAPPFRFVIRAVRSTDDGKTWSPRRELVYQPKGKMNARLAAGAPSVVQIRPGQLLVSFQTDEDADPASPNYDYLHHARFKYVTSGDDMRTWGNPVKLTTANQTPALWGALCVAEPGVVYAATGFGGQLWFRRGTVAQRPK